MGNWLSSIDLLHGGNVEVFGTAVGAVGMTALFVYMVWVYYKATRRQGMKTVWDLFKNDPRVKGKPIWDYRIWAPLSFDEEATVRFVITLGKTKDSLETVELTFKIGGEVT